MITFLKQTEADYERELRDLEKLWGAKLGPCIRRVLLVPTKRNTSDEIKSYASGIDAEIDGLLSIHLSQTQATRRYVAQC